MAENDFSSTETESGAKFVVFSLGEEFYAAPAACVSEVVQMPEVTALPNVPEWLAGVTSLRGEIISVVNLAKLENPQNDFNPHSKSKLIALRGQNSPFSVGLLADKINEIIPLSPDKIQFDGQQNYPPYIFGTTPHKSKILNLLETEKLISALEI